MTGSGDPSALRGPGAGVIRGRPLLVAASALYLGAVLWITLGPQPLDADANGLLERALRVLHRVIGLTWIDRPLVEFCANIVLFVPLGILGMLLLGRGRWGWVLLAGLLLTCGIETTQLFLATRVSDVRDLLANSLGAATGVGVMLLATSRDEPRRTTRE